MNSLTNDLTELSALAKLLHLTDKRSVIRFCQKSHIAIMKTGKASYVSTVALREFFNNGFNRFANGHFDSPQRIIEAHQSGDMLDLAESMEAPITPKEKKKYRMTKKRSKSAADLLNNFKRG